MKKNSPKEESSFYASDQTLKKSPSENILVFLFLAAILLSVNVFHIYRHFLPQKNTPQPADNIPNRYIWLTGSSVLSEGLYQFYPEQLEKQFPEIHSLLSKQSDDNTSPLVTAIKLNPEKPLTIKLPPQVANIFLKPIPINRADEIILTSLPGIGPSLAERIVMRRNQQGPFRSKEELLQVTGIGPKKFAALVEHITID